MNEFEKHWSDFYCKGKLAVKKPEIEIFINDEDEELSILTCSEGKTRVSINSKIAAELSLEEKQATTDLGSFKALLSKTDIAVHSPDNIYYSAKPALNNAENKSISIRKLTENDEGIYSEFTRVIDPEELDNAYVELDHWVVFGLFVNDKLVSACSMYPWEKTNIADLGVITLPEYRGKGMAKRLVNHAHQEISNNGYILQYRSQTDNLPSIKLAESLKLNFYGVWEPIIESEASY